MTFVVTGIESQGFSHHPTAVPYVEVSTEVRKHFGHLFFGYFFGHPPTVSGETLVLVSLLCDDLVKNPTSASKLAHEENLSHDQTHESQCCITTLISMKS